MVLPMLLQLTTSNEDDGILSILMVMELHTIHGVLKMMIYVALCEACSKHIYMYSPAPLVSRPPQGDTYDDTILAGVVSKNPKV